MGGGACGKYSHEKIEPGPFSLTGPCSVYALAKQAERNYSNVHGDIARLVELGLVERAEDETVFVPFAEIEIRLPLALAA